MIVNIIPGLSASIRQSDLTLTGFFREATMGIVPPTQRHQHVTRPGRRSCIVDSAEYILSHRSEESKLFLVGKSLGAVRTWWLLRKHWNQLKDFEHITAVLIDPHGPQPGDHVCGSYGRGSRSLRWDDRWTEHPDFELTVIFQRNRFPRGAKFEGAPCSNQYRQVCMIRPADHWNMTDMDTSTGKKVAQELSRALADLMHK